MKYEEIFISLLAGAKDYAEKVAAADAAGTKALNEGHGFDVNCAEATVKRFLSNKYLVDIGFRWSFNLPLFTIVVNNKTYWLLASEVAETPFAEIFEMLTPKQKQDELRQLILCGAKGDENAVNDLLKYRKTHLPH